MKQLLVLVLALLSISSLAENKVNRCLDKFTDGYSVDSNSFKLNTDSIDFDVDENDLMARGIFMIKTLGNRLGCNPDHDLNFAKSPYGRSHSYCRRVSPTREHSLSCYIETNIGFFFVTEDLQTDAFIIFNRWD